MIVASGDSDAVNRLHAGDPEVPDPRSGRHQIKGAYNPISSISVSGGTQDDDITHLQVRKVTVRQITCHEPLLLS